jgi:hypothetical protein
MKAIIYDPLDCRPPAEGETVRYHHYRHPHHYTITLYPKYGAWDFGVEEHGPGDARAWIDANRYSHVHETTGDAMTYAQAWIDGYNHNRAA